MKLTGEKKKNFFFGIMEHDGVRTHDLHVTGSYTNQYTMMNMQFGQLFFCRVKIFYYMTFYWQIATISAHCVTYPGVRYPKENHYLLVVPICRMRSCFLTRSRCSRMNSHSLKQIFSVDQMIRAWHCLHHLMLI